jgi:hypothetical protein
VHQRIDRSLSDDHIGNSWAVHPYTHVDIGRRWSGTPDKGNRLLDDPAFDHFVLSIAQRHIRPS